MTSPEFDPGAEFDRQVRTLSEGWGRPDLAELAAPLKPIALSHPAAQDAPQEGRVPFLIVVPRALLPLEEALPRLTLAGKAKPGVIDRNYQGPQDVASFVTIQALLEDDASEKLPYLVFDIERGEEFCDVVPLAALETIEQRGRTPLSIEEGVALLTHFPALLAKNKCFELAGSRNGDKRVPALWISEGAPKLGWCWQGNPHTWLGMASAGSRFGALATVCC
ncbi:DUF5701 family protein [Catenulispora yoronensis]|uniref:DUF5701 family protein n=1 Tax=Catenulispora yoronensis TaxID=450799 RepID=A0ABN2VIN0_9ACTN